MLISLVLSFAAQGVEPSIHRPDTVPLSDPGKIVYEIGRTSVKLHYATAQPCETKVEIRQGNTLSVESQAAPTNYRVVTTRSANGLDHDIALTGLEPGKRYLYRLFDPGATPTTREAAWGAEAPWSREYAVSTEAPAGRKTIIHLPVKVLLMPNVINVGSAIQPDGSIAPEPTKITPDQIALIKNEFRLASRVFWCNSGMRLWVDFKFFVDDRWQRWGTAPPSAPGFFQNMPLCRSYGGKDYLEPGGGTFTIVDSRNPSVTLDTPVNDGYQCQVEMAWPRKWDAVLRKWSFYPSGGGTLGIEDLPRGVPSRIQFLAGGDTAWLAEHEFHHQLESLGEFCLGNAEDDRIVFDHPSPRHRTRRGDATYDEQDWTTTGPHGEQWDVMRYWDRRVTDCQWLRFAFGTTETVLDKDGDGFPDNDPRLPLDAKRMAAYAPANATYEAACNWDWPMLPLQPSWVKDRSGVSGGYDHTLGWLGWFVEKRGSDHTFLISSAMTFEGVSIPKYSASLTGQDEWAGVPGAGTIHRPSMHVSYRHAYDESGYYGQVLAKGDVSHIDVDLDGDEKGMFTPPAALGFSIVNLKPAAGQAGPTTLPVSVRPTFGGVGGKTPWLTWKSSRKADGTLIVDFKIANGGDSPWYWHGAGHRIGVAVNAYDTVGRGYSMGEPYRMHYCRMLEGRGRTPSPPTPTALPTADTALKPGDKAFAVTAGWVLGDDGFYHHEGLASGLTISGQKAVDFDLEVEVDGAGSVTFGGLSAQTQRVDASSAYSASLDSGALALHANGDDFECGGATSGRHLLELRRRSGGLWLLVDGKTKGYALDKNPKVLLNRFVLWADGGKITVRNVSYRTADGS